MGQTFFQTFILPHGLNTRPLYYERRGATTAKNLWGYL